MVKKEQVLEAVLKSSQPITLSDLWKSNAEKYGWSKEGKTPTHTLSYDLSQLCREGKLKRVKVARGYAYCEPGKCNGDELSCPPLKKRSSKPKKGPKKTIQKKKPTTSKPKAPRQKEPKKPIQAEAVPEDYEYGQGNFDNYPEDAQEEEYHVPSPAAHKPATNKPAARRRKATVAPKGKFAFANSVAKTFHSLRPGYKISKKAVYAVDSIITEQVEKIANVAHNMLASSHVSTLNQRTLQYAMQVTYTPELAKHMIGESVKAATKLQTYVGKKESRSKKAGLTISSSRIKHLLQRLRTAKRYSADVDIYLTGGIEYLTREVLDEAANVTTDRKKKMLNPRDLFLTVKRDQDLKLAVVGTFGGAGVVPPN